MTNGQEMYIVTRVLTMRERIQQRIWTHPNEFAEMSPSALNIYDSDKNLQD